MRPHRGPGQTCGAAHNEIGAGRGNRTLLCSAWKAGGKPAACPLCVGLSPPVHHRHPWRRHPAASVSPVLPQATRKACDVRGLGCRCFSASRHYRLIRVQLPLSGHTGSGSRTIQTAISDHWPALFRPSWANKKPSTWLGFVYVLIVNPGRLRRFATPRPSQGWPVSLHSLITDSTLSLILVWGHLRSFSHRALTGSTLNHSPRT